MKTPLILIVAGGKAGSFRLNSTALQKAMLPIKSRPMIEYMVEASQRSDAERVFIVQDEDQNLEAQLSSIEKCTFINRPLAKSSLGEGIILGLEAISNRYEEMALCDKIVLLQPCDTPLVKNDQINRLFMLAQERKEWCLQTIIQADLARKRFPGKKFGYVFSKNPRNSFCWQMGVLINGELIYHFKNGRSEEIRALVNDINNARILRHFNILMVTYLVCKRFQLKQAPLLTKALGEMLFQCLKLETVNQVITRYFSVPFGFLETQDAEFSGDIDTPQDYQSVLGFPWQLQTPGGCSDGH